MAGKKGATHRKIINGRKRCSGCNQMIPADTAHFDRHAKGYGGLNSVCKDCRRVSRKANNRRPEVREANRIRQAEVRAQASLFVSAMTLARCLVRDMDNGRTPNAAYKLASRLIERVEDGRVIEVGL